MLDFWTLDFGLWTLDFKKILLRKLINNWIDTVKIKRIIVISSINGMS